MPYKFKSWWYILGLVLLGIFSVKPFNVQAIYYLVLGLFLIDFAHAFEDKKRIWTVYLLVVALLSFNLSFFQILIESILLEMFVLYSIFSKYPISAFYKGFGWGILFLLPIGSFNPWYIPISLIASLSEIFHEANDFETDKKEGRYTTAHWLNFKINRKVRRKWKLILGIIGLILLSYFYFR